MKAIKINRKFVDIDNDWFSTDEQRDEIRSELIELDCLASDEDIDTTLFVLKHLGYIATANPTSEVE